MNKQVTLHGLLGIDDNKANKLTHEFASIIYCNSNFIPATNFWEWSLDEVMKGAMKIAQNKYEVMFLSIQIGKALKDAKFFQEVYDAGKLITTKIN